MTVIQQDSGIRSAISHPSNPVDRDEMMRLMAIGKTSISVYVLPGGKMPERQSAGAVGFDVHARAIVSAFEQDPDNKNFRKTLFDFKTEPRGTSQEIRALRRHIFPEPITKENRENRGFIYRLYPGERTLVGAGVVIELNPHDAKWMVWVAPRSGLASKYGITIGNTPGTIDCDYRGEAGIVLVNLGENPFDISHNMRIAQFIFQKAEIPALIQASKYEVLTTTVRAGGGFGSTGLTG